jgi:ketosteroid isomerase-like protein
MRTLVALLLTVILAVPVCAADGSEEDKEALRALARLFEQAVAQRDLKRFQSVLAPEFAATLVTDEVVNRETMTRFWDWVWGLIGPKGQWTVKIEPDPTMFFGDVAVARGVSNDRILTEKGREYAYSWHWTVVLQKREGQWRPVAGHGSLDPLGNVFIQAEQAWMKGIFGVGGLVAGLVVGGGAMLFLRRRRR